MLKIAVTLSDGREVEFTAEGMGAWTGPLHWNSGTDRRYVVSDGTQVLMDSVYDFASTFADGNL